MFENSGSLKSTVPTTSKWMSPNCGHNHNHHIRKSRLFTPPVVIFKLCENLSIFAFSDSISLLIAILLLSVETPLISLTFQESIAFHLLIWMLSVKITQWKLAYHANSVDYLIVSLPPCLLQELSPTYQKNAFFAFFIPSLACSFLYHYSILQLSHQSRCFPFFLLFDFSHRKSFIFFLIPRSPSTSYNKLSIFTHLIQKYSQLASLHSSWNHNYNHPFVDPLTFSHQTISFCSLSFDRFSIFASLLYLASA